MTFLFFGSWSKFSVKAYAFFTKIDLVKRSQVFHLLEIIQNLSTYRITVVLSCLILLVDDSE